MENLLTKIENGKDKSEIDFINDTKCKANFLYFFYEVFALGVRRIENVFCFGDHLEEWAYRLQEYDNTATISARYHLKTTIAIAYLAWQLYKMDSFYTEWLFLGYKEDLAAYHLKRLKRYLAAIPEYFDGYISLTNAETILHYMKDGQEFICEPEGIQSFKRGRHPDGIICDDILKDPEVKLDISQLRKIEKAFTEEVMSMPKDELHVFGTPQDIEDLFAFLERTPSFNCKRYPAEVNSTKKIALWPECWPWERLKQKEKDIRQKAYNKEFLCSPARSEDGYFTLLEIDSLINERFKNYGYREKAKINGYCYGGLDIGKKRHPSHISIYAENRRGKLIQIASIWLDGVDYTTQLEICKQLIDNYPIQRLYYDDTRAELEGFKERGELPPEMEGITFTHKGKFEMAAKFEKRVKAGSLVLLKDERQRRQILNVDNDLKSMETDEGHGDSFWSNALAVDAAEGPQVNIRLL